VLSAGGSSPAPRTTEGKESRCGLAAAEHLGASAAARPLRRPGVAFTADGQWIISGSEDMTIRLWDAHPGGTVVSAV